MRWTCSNNNIRSSYEFLPVSISVYRKFEKSIKRLTDDSWDYDCNGRNFSIAKNSRYYDEKYIGLIVGSVGYAHLANHLNNEQTFVKANWIIE